MMQPGPKNLITDVQGLLVGNAQDEKIKTGVTVLSGNKPLVTSYCVMGGAPGTRETDLLAPDKTIKGVDALVCLLYTSPSPRDATLSRMPSSA